LVFLKASILGSFEKINSHPRISGQEFRGSTHIDHFVLLTTFLPGRVQLFLQT
jgi:hypothetical protein